MRRTHSLAAARRVVALGLLVLFGPGCVSSPKGSLFEALTPPDARSTLVYVYRADTLRGTGAANVQLDGEGVSNLQNGEYLGFLVDPGSHTLRARLRWMGIVPRSWSSLVFAGKGGETIYLKIFASYLIVADPGAPVASPERTDSKPEVGLSIAIVDAEKARGEIGAMRRGTLD